MWRCNDALLVEQIGKRHRVLLAPLLSRNFDGPRPFRRLLGLLSTTPHTPRCCRASGMVSHHVGGALNTSEQHSPHRSTSEHYSAPVLLKHHEKSVPLIC
ncbi:hypothetical protein E2C01_025812 [Portunus trituberculatus]|uniref:Uncharacterized protein n=1 Tax=Portunus trituberculatus TaxID=210409 RepID=A0A5B7EDX4_PORTR|nr:hypothetical protein [Portunus trituberculatus]